MINPEPAWVGPTSNVLSALFGAAIGYVATHRAENKRLKKERNSVAYSAIFKMQAICNELTQLNDILCNVSENRFAELAEGVELWQLLPMTFGWDSVVEFTSEELAIVAMTKATDEAVKMQEAQSAHRIYTTAYNRLSDLKMQLSTFDGVVASEDDTITMKVGPSETARMLPQLRALASKLGDDLAAATFEARECAKRLGPLLKKHYKFDDLITVTFSDEE